MSDDQNNEWKRPSGFVWTVEDLARELKISARLCKVHKPHGHPAQPKYGTKKRQGKVVEHLAEKRVIEAVRDMRLNNLSLRQIARFLTRVGVPTKQRGVAWHPEMVKRLLSDLGQVESDAATIPAGD